MYKKTFYVYCDNCGRIPVDDTDFVNIEEDCMGRDLYKFICKKCGKQGKSNVYS